MKRAGAAILTLLLPVAACQGQLALTEKSVASAIAKAVDYLYSEANTEGIWDKEGPPNLPLAQIDHATANQGGHTALVLNALASAGQQNDARFRKALDWLMKQELVGTYSLALRLELIHRLRQPEAYRNIVKRDTGVLLASARPEQGMAMWAYAPAPSKLPYEHMGDLSNVNYAVLGLWAASDEREEIRGDVWLGLEKTWVLGQHPSGGWSYFPQPLLKGPNDPHASARGSMTTAGIASLYLVIDQHYARAGALGSYRKTAAYAAIGKGLKWMEDNFSARGNPGGNPWFATYYFYNIERVATAGGLKFFGTHDWFREIAETLLTRQGRDGAIKIDTDDAYGGAVTDTAFALLFLAKGSAPIIVNKLQHAGDWDNRLRELGGLTDWLARQSERPANWQVVNLKAPAEDLTDSRLLYVAGTKALELAPEEKAKLKRYVELGGVLVFHPDNETAPFAPSAKKLAREFWPQLEFANVDMTTHLLGNLYMPARAGDRPPRVEALSSPVRLLAVILHNAPAQAWERREFLSQKAMFALGANLHFFVNDRTQMKDLPTKLAYFAEDFRRPAATAVVDMPMARLKHGDNPFFWDPEPLAFERFARLMAEREKINCPATPAAPADLDAAKFKVAHLTGVGAVNFKPEETAGLVKFVKGGGTLIVDQAGGPKKDSGDDPFDGAFRNFVSQQFGPEALEAMPLTHPYLKGLDKMTYRYVGGPRRSKLPIKLECVLLDGRPAIIYSRYDLTCGLLGIPNPLVVGADDDTAYTIVSRILMGAYRGQQNN